MKDSVDLQGTLERVQNGDDPMFGNLDEQIDVTVGGPPKPGQKVLRYLIMAIVSMIVFGGVFMGIWFLEY